MIDQIGVAFDDVAAIGAQHAFAAGGKGAHVQRQHDVLRNDVADGFRIAQEASCDSRTMVEKPVRKSEFCISCTMPDRLAFDDFDGDRVHRALLHRFHRALPVSMRMFLNSSTRALWPMGMTVVASSWSTMPGLRR
jgi:hypothetical protein